MAFEFKPDESIPHGVKRIVRKQIDKVCNDLTGDDQTLSPEAVHDARKRCKRVRAVVRMLRDELGKAHYQGANSSFRDVGRPLSEVRDAHALVEALDDLLERYSEEISQEQLAPLHTALLEQEHDLTQKWLGSDSELPHVVEAVKQVRRRVKKWPLDDDFGSLSCGLQSSYKRARQAFAAATAEPTDENLHDWRKRTKDLMYQLTVLRPMRPQPLSEQIKQAKNLTDLLGDDHDLLVLRQRVAELGQGEEVVAALQPLIDRRRGELQQDAFALGEKFHHDRPRQFLARLQAFWQAWQLENEAARFDPSDGHPTEQTGQTEQPDQSSEEARHAEDELTAVNQQCEQARQQLHATQEQLEEVTRAYQYAEERLRQLGEVLPGAQTF